MRSLVLILTIILQEVRDFFKKKFCAEELLSDWLGDDAYMFKSPKLWKEIIGDSDRIESVKTWEMDCFSKAWDDWLATDKKFALDDRQHFEAIIKPYTCFVGIYIKLKRAM